MRGRPPITRARVLDYLAENGPCPVIQVARETGIDRSYVYRVLYAVYGQNFRLRWHESAKTVRGGIGEAVAA